MMKLYKIACLAACMAVGVLQAQDIHFSQYNAAPLALNPGLTGVGACDWRIGGTYRNQWNSVTTPYVTYEVFGDLPIKKFGANKLAAGALIYNDVSGDGKLTNLSALGNVSFVLGLGGRDDHNLSIGVQGGLMHKSLDFAALTWGNQWDGDQFDQNLDNFETIGENINNFNLSVGLAYHNKVSESFNITGGFAAFNLLTPEEKFLEDINNTPNDLGMRIAGHLKAGITFGGQFGVIPSVLYQTQSGAKEIIVGSDFGYFLNNSSFPATFFIGAAYRLDDAVIASLGMDYKNFRFGASYDINTSTLQDASGGKGGMEFSLVYTGCILPVIPKTYVMPCPRY